MPCYNAPASRSGLRGPRRCTMNTPERVWNRTSRLVAFTHVGIFILGALGGALYAALAGQESNYDLYNYHYYIPYALLHRRLGFDYAPAQLQSYINPLPFVPLWVLSHHLPPIGVGVVYGAAHGLTL